MDYFTLKGSGRAWRMKTSIPHGGIHLRVNFIHNLLGKGTFPR